MKTAVDWLTYMGFTIEEETERHVVVSHPSINGLIAIRNTKGGTHMAFMYLKWGLGDSHPEVVKVKELFRELMETDA